MKTIYNELNQIFLNKYFFQSSTSEEELVAADERPDIRIFTLNQHFSTSPLLDVDVKNIQQNWTVASRGNKNNTKSFHSINNCYFQMQVSFHSISMKIFHSINFQ